MTGVYWWTLIVKLLFLPETKSQVHCLCCGFLNATIVQGFTQQARGIACGYWIQRDSSFQMQPPKDKIVPAPCMGWNETVSCPKFIKPDLRVLRTEKDFLWRWHLDSLLASATTAVFTTIFCIPISLLPPSKVKFENILSSPLALNSGEREI